MTKGNNYLSTEQKSIFNNYLLTDLKSILEKLSSTYVPKYVMSRERERAGEANSKFIQIKLNNIYICEYM